MTAGAEVRKDIRSVARIRLDAETRPTQASSLEAGERPKGTPKERKTPKRKQRYLGQV